MSDRALVLRDYMTDLGGAEVLREMVKATPELWLALQIRVDVAMPWEHMGRHSERRWRAGGREAAVIVCFNKGRWHVRANWTVDRGISAASKECAKEEADKLLRDNGWTVLG